MRDLIKDKPLKDKKRRKKAQHPAGIEHKTSRVSLYCCATSLLTTMRTLNQAYLHQLVNDLGDWKIVFLDHQVLDALHDEGRRVLNELAERQNSTEFSGLLLWALIILALTKAGMILTHHKSTPKFLLGFN